MISNDKNNFLAIPTEIIYSIFCFCDFTTIKRCESVCKLFKQLLEDPLFWKNKYKQSIPLFFQPNPKLKENLVKAMQDVLFRHGMNSSSLLNNNPAFSSRSPEKTPMACTALANTPSFSIEGFQNGVAAVKRNNTYILFELFDDDEKITCISIFQESFACGSQSGCLSLTDLSPLQSGEEALIYPFEEIHLDKIYCIHLTESAIFSSSRDCSIKKTNRSGEVILHVELNTYRITCFAAYENLLFCGTKPFSNYATSEFDSTDSSDLSPIQWCDHLFPIQCYDMESLHPVYKASDSSYFKQSLDSRIFSLSIDPQKKLISCLSIYQYTEWKIETGECLRSITLDAFDTHKNELKQVNSAPLIDHDVTISQKVEIPSSEDKEEGLAIDDREWESEWNHPRAFCRRDHLILFLYPGSGIVMMDDVSETRVESLQLPKSLRNPHKGYCPETMLLLDSSTLVMTHKKGSLTLDFSQKNKKREIKKNENFNQLSLDFEKNKRSKQEEDQ